MAVIDEILEEKCRVSTPFTSIVCAWPRAAPEPELRSEPEFAGTKKNLAGTGTDLTIYLNHCTCACICQEH